MLLRHQGILTLLTLVALTSVMLGGGVWLASARIDPATASRNQLLRHLVLADLQAEPLRRQVAWVDRLQLELGDDHAPAPAAVSLSENHRERLFQNMETLQSVWFRTRTAQYAALPLEEREAFLVEQLRIIEVWSQLANVVLEGSASASATATPGLVERIDTWIHNASDEERAAMVAAVQDGTLCWLSMTDLERQPLTVKRDLAERLAQELDRGARAHLGKVSTDAERRARLARNAGHLLEAYVFVLAERYSQLPKAERQPFIDDQLAAVERWGLAEMLSEDSADHSPSGNHTRSALALVERSEQWIEHAPDAERPQVREFIVAVQQRLLWRHLPAWLRRP